MREMKWFLVITLVSALFFWVTGTPLAQTTNLPKSMAIVGGTTATNNFAFIAGIAEMITKYIGIKTIPAAGTLGRNVLTLHKKEAEFALTNDDRAYFAVRGGEEYKQFGAMNIRLMFSTTNAFPFCFITRRDANLTSVSDLRGKKVMCVYPGNPAFTKGADIHFEAAGMSRKDVHALSYSGYQEGNMALKEKRISAYIHPMPVASVSSYLQELNYEVPVRLLSSPKDKLATVLSKYPYFRQDTLPAKVYGDLIDQKDLVSIGVAETFVCLSGHESNLRTSARAYHIYSSHKDMDGRPSLFGGSSLSPRSYQVL
jgi:TRAP transporter TAXI family solute receptor